MIPLSWYALAASWQCGEPTCRGSRSYSHLDDLSALLPLRLNLMKPPPEKVEIPDGLYFLIIVEDGKVTHFTPNVSLSHADFVKRSVGTLPKGAWVGSATKNDGYLTAINSYTFYQNQLPASPEIQKVVQAQFC